MTPELLRDLTTCIDDLLEEKGPVESADVERIFARHRLDVVRIDAPTDDYESGYEFGRDQLLEEARVDAVLMRAGRGAAVMAIAIDDLEALAEETGGD